MKLTKWTKAQIEDFIEWHERRMTECGYSLKVQAALRMDRDSWLLGVR